MITDPEELAHHMFVIADRFDKAGHVLANNGDTSLGIAGIVNIAFATEMYFKCLIVLDTKKDPSWKHDFVILFSKLTPESQSKLKSLYLSHPEAQRDQMIAEMFRAHGATPEDMSFDAVLARSKDAFTNIRYIYQYPFKTNWDAGVITACLRRLILDLRPQWI